MNNFLQQCTNGLVKFYLLPLLLVPVALFAYRQNYPVVSLEISILLFFLIVLGIGLHYILARGKFFLQHALPWCVIMLVLSFLPGAWSLFTWLCIGLLVFGLQLILAEHFPIVVTIMSLTFLIMQFLTPPYKEENIYPNFNHASSHHSTLKPPLRIHIILDEQGGLDELHATNPTSTQQRYLTNLSQQHHLLVYPKVNSHYSNTVNSIPNLLNFQQPTNLAHTHMGYFLNQPAATDAGGSLSQNIYFDWLMQQGYRIHVYQLAYINYCAHRGVSSCFTYPAKQAKVIHESSLAAPDKLQLFFLRLLWSSQFWQNLRQEYFATIYPWQIEHGFNPWPFFLLTANHTSLTALSVIQHVHHDLPHYHDGDAIFIHLLIPHAPYIFNSSCQLKPVPQWLDNWDLLPIMNSPTRLTQRQAAYWQQVHCTADQVMRFIVQPALNQSAQRAEIFIHGDHGSRIVQHSPDSANLNHLTPLDLQASFLTLALVHTHHPMPPLHALQSLPQLMRAWLALAPNPTISTDQIYLVPEAPGDPLVPNSLTTLIDSNVYQSSSAKA